MIKVLRLLEYTFNNFEEMDEHFSKLGVPQDGVIKHRNVTIRSCTLLSPFQREESDADTQ